jgi:cell division septum initiation protein DivIVA
MHEAQHSFDVVLRGYDRSQVAETIERLEADFRIAIADRDAAASRSTDLAGQLSALHAQLEAMRRKAATANAPTFENISERIQHMLQLAEEEAGEIRRAAEIDAHAVREQTAAEERAMLERHAAGQAEVERMLAEAGHNAEQIAHKAQIRADELVAKAQERVARLDAESQARRAKAEEDFDIAQRARRAEAARMEEERERVSTQAARQRVAAAEQHSAQLVAEAEAKAAVIRGVRDELTSRLQQARQVLAAMPDLDDRAPARPSADRSTDREAGLRRSARPESVPPTQPAMTPGEGAGARPDGEPVPAGAGYRDLDGRGAAARPPLPARPTAGSGPGTAGGQAPEKPGAQTVAAPAAVGENAAGSARTSARPSTAPVDAGSRPVGPGHS